MSPRRGPVLDRVLTIGAYGFDQRSFLDALKLARVDLFIDIRARRGVRGRDYAFANAGRLQGLLALAGIGYVHVPELAPSEETRAAQYAADEKAGIAKRKRTVLSAAFCKAFERERMRDFSAIAFARDVVQGAKRPVLFCVETEPGACHRSIVAKHIGAALRVPIENLRP